MIIITILGSSTIIALYIINAIIVFADFSIGYGAKSKREFWLSLAMPFREGILDIIEGYKELPEGPNEKEKE